MFKAKLEAAIRQKMMAKFSINKSLLQKSEEKKDDKKPAEKR